MSTAAADDKMTFVIKHAFTDVKNKENGKKHYEKTEKYFNIPWTSYIHSDDYSSDLHIWFECMKPKGDEKWSIDTTIETKVLTRDGEKLFKDNRLFAQVDANLLAPGNELKPLDEYLVDGNLTVEYHVTIHKVTGIETPILRRFDDESAKELSDVVLMVKKQKFYVFKKYFAYHSTYFKSLFFGNFGESNQSEIELKDIDPCDFQKFLEVLYCDPDITDDNVDGILHIADMYDTKVVIRQCEKFLMNDSDKDLKERFLLATKYKLQNLKKKCMPEFNTSKDIVAVIPEDPSQFDYAVWKELLNLSIDFTKKLAEKTGTTEA